jgi:hypothetical protein
MLLERIDSAFNLSAFPLMPAQVRFMYTNTGEAFSADRCSNYVMIIITITFIVLEYGILNLTALWGWQQY